MEGPHIPLYQPHCLLEEGQHLTYHKQCSSGPIHQKLKKHACCLPVEIVLQLSMYKNRDSTSKECFIAKQTPVRFSAATDTRPNISLSNIHLHPHMYIRHILYREQKPEKHSPPHTHCTLSWQATLAAQ